MRKDSNIVVIPFHGSKDIPIPTLKSIIKQA
jgi:predicted RNA binding protein YcfA (HicA-like mRNA interferase family)